MSRWKKGEAASIHRTDLLSHHMNAAKQAAVLELLRHWRKGAVGLAVEQWRLFFETGRFDKNAPDKSLTAVIGAANRLQMCRWHVVDFGLSTLLASEDGGMFGQGWLKALRRYDARITSIARHVQRCGGKPRRSRRTRAAVAALQGFIRSEIGRLINRLVAMKRPARFVVERLNFQNPELSARINRLLQNCGRKVFRDKLTDLEQRLGITSEQVSPAYTSQSCSKCGYVDKRNRPSQAKFSCLWCGHEKQADVNAGCNIGQRRSLPIGSVWVTKAVVLSDLVTRFCARWPAPRGSTGSRGAPADPRLSNPYFKAWADAARSTPVARRAKSVASPALVAARFNWVVP